MEAGKAGGQSALLRGRHGHGGAAAAMGVGIEGGGEGRALFKGFLQFRMARWPSQDSGVVSKTRSVNAVMQP
jgi:hypothetical protein